MRMMGLPMAGDKLEKIIDPAKGLVLGHITSYNDELTGFSESLMKLNMDSVFHYSGNAYYITSALAKEKGWHIEDCGYWKHWKRQNERKMSELDAMETKAAIDVMVERRRQINLEKFDAQRDDKYVNNELSDAALCYVLGSVEIAGWPLWPWDVSWWKPTDRRRNLVKAAALLIAEIERMDRNV